jgi:hypothetical protein
MCVSSAPCPVDVTTNNFVWSDLGCHFLMLGGRLYKFLNAKTELKKAEVKTVRYNFFYNYCQILLSLRCTVHVAMLEVEVQQQGTWTCNCTNAYASFSGGSIISANWCASSSTDPLSILPAITISTHRCACPLLPRHNIHVIHNGPI